MSLLGLIIVLLLAYFVIFPLFKALFGVRKQAKAWRDMYRQAANASRGFAQNQQHQEPEPEARKKKVFSRDEGEYIDFEEVTDTTTASSDASGSTYTHTHTETRYSGPKESQVSDAEWTDLP